MGYDKINIYGTSYGTRVALTYKNKFPDHVRTAVLKGLVLDNLVIPMNFANDAQRSLDILIEDCKTNAECNRAFSNFEDAVKDLLN